MVYPVANLLYLSFHDYSPLRSADVEWVGVRNYAVAITEPATRASLWTTVVFTLSSVAIEVLVALFVAVLMGRVTLDYGGRGRQAAQPRLRRRVHTSVRHSGGDGGSRLENVPRSAISDRSTR